MTFEYDPAKSESNQRKHGIDFVTAQEIWADGFRLERSALSATEPRWQVIGKAQGRVWSAFITYRNQNIRLISVRRACGDEKELYYGH